MDDRDRQSEERGHRASSLLDLANIATVTDLELETADDEGFLAGNQEYVDLSILGLLDLAACIERESALLHHIRGSEDGAAAEEAFLAGRKLQDEVEALWHLDVGVASATVALITAGAHPFLSCNGGVFGAHHTRPFPMVRFYLRGLAPTQLLTWCNEVGLTILNEDGILVLRADDTGPFFAFAQAVLDSKSQATSASIS